MSMLPEGDYRCPTTALGGVTTATSASAPAWARASSRRSRANWTPASRCPPDHVARPCRASARGERISQNEQSLIQIVGCLAAAMQHATDNTVLGNFNDARDPALR